MLLELDAQRFRRAFSTDPHPFLSDAFVSLNQGKVEQVVRLADPGRKPGLGIIGGIRDGMLRSPFSAPFGGMHCAKPSIRTSEIDGFLVALREWIATNGLKGFELILPPPLYQSSFNAKLINALARSELPACVPDITNWMELDSFDFRFETQSAREACRQAERHQLAFSPAEEAVAKRAVYELVRDNRERLGRSIFMTFEEVTAMEALWPVDYFQVRTTSGEMAASAILYRFLPDIAYALFWGDSAGGRPLRAMDFLVFHLWSHYKRAGFRIVDLGTSTEEGYPNEGLLRFKEHHGATCGLRHRYRWEANASGGQA